jgi:protein-S-isoprenylcysteine O-methyltransferase Ste14
MNIELIFRVVVLLVLVSAFSISGYFRKRARESGDVIERKEEGGIVLALRMGFALPLLASLLLYVFYPPALSWTQITLPLWLRSLAAIIAVLCAPLIYWVFSSIGRNISETVLTKSDHQLVTHGPYRWVRHPLYSSALLLLCSISLIAGSWFIFAYFVVGTIAFRTLVIPAEEQKLIDAFGQDYRDYQHRSGALLPKLR